MAVRRCDECQTLMPPFIPRKRKGDKQVCWACHKTDRGGYVSAEPVSKTADRQCAACEGTGEMFGVECGACDGSGVRDEDEGIPDEGIHHFTHDQPAEHIMWNAVAAHDHLRNAHGLGDAEIDRLYQTKRPGETFWQGYRGAHDQVHEEGRRQAIPHQHGTATGPDSMRSQGSIYTTDDAFYGDPHWEDFETPDCHYCGGTDHTSAEHEVREGWPTTTDDNYVSQPRRLAVSNNPDHPSNHVFKPVNADFQICTQCNREERDHPHLFGGNDARSCSICGKDYNSNWSNHDGHMRSKYQWMVMRDNPAPEDPSGLWHLSARDQESCPHDGGWNLHGQCKQCGYTPPTEADEPCDNPWCVENEPEHTKGEHIDPAHLDPYHPDYQNAEHEVEDAIGEHDGLLDLQPRGPSKYSSIYGDEPDFEYEDALKALHDEIKKTDPHIDHMTLADAVDKSIERIPDRMAGYAEHLRDGWLNADNHPMPKEDRERKAQDVFNMYDEQGIQPGDDLSQHPNFSHQVGYVRTDMLDRHREYDRASEDPYYGGAISRRTIDAIKDDWKAGGRGILHPVMLEYHPESHTAYLGEGNHRLVAAKELGIPALPTRVVKAPYHRNDGAPVDGPQKLHADEYGYFPASAHPSEVLPDHYLWHPDQKTASIYDDYDYSQDVTPAPRQADPILPAVPCAEHEGKGGEATSKCEEPAGTAQQKADRINQLKSHLLTSEHGDFLNDDAKRMIFDRNTPWSDLAHYHNFHHLVDDEWRKKSTDPEHQSRLFGNGETWHIHGSRKHAHGEHSHFMDGHRHTQVDVSDDQSHQSYVDWMQSAQKVPVDLSDTDALRKHMLEAHDEGGWATMADPTQLRAEHDGQHAEFGRDEWPHAVFMDNSHFHTAAIYGDEPPQMRQLMPEELYHDHFHNAPHDNTDYTHQLRKHFRDANHGPLESFEHRYRQQLGLEPNDPLYREDLTMIHDMAHEFGDNHPEGLTDHTHGDESVHEYQPDESRLQSLNSATAGIYDDYDYGQEDAAPAHQHPAGDDDDAKRELIWNHMTSPAPQGHGYDLDDWFTHIERNSLDNVKHLHDMVHRKQDKKLISGERTPEDWHLHGSRKTAHGDHETPDIGPMHEGSDYETLHHHRDGTTYMPMLGCADGNCDQKFYNEDARSQHIREAHPGTYAGPSQDMQMLKDIMKQREEERAQAERGESGAFPAIHPDDLHALHHHLTQSAHGHGDLFYGESEGYSPDDAYDRRQLHDMHDAAHREMDEEYPEGRYGEHDGMFHFHVPHSEENDYRRHVEMPNYAPPQEKYDLGAATTTHLVRAHGWGPEEADSHLDPVRAHEGIHSDAESYPDDYDDPPFNHYHGNPHQAARGETPWDFNDPDLIRGPKTDNIKGLPKPIKAPDGRAWTTYGDGPDLEFFRPQKGESRDDYDRRIKTEWSEESTDSKLRKKYDMPPHPDAASMGGEFVRREPQRTCADCKVAEGTIPMGGYGGYKNSDRICDNCYEAGHVNIRGGTPGQTIQYDHGSPVTMQHGPYDLSRGRQSLNSLNKTAGHAQVHVMGGMPPEYPHAFMPVCHHPDHHNDPNLPETAFGSPKLWSGNVYRGNDTDSEGWHAAWDEAKAHDILHHTSEDSSSPDPNAEYPF